MEKVRNIPHVDGNFSVHISLRLPKLKSVKEYLDSIELVIKQNSKSDIKYESVCEEGINYYHISLCNNFFLKYHQIDSFLNKIKKTLKEENTKSLSLYLTTNIKYYTNEFNTRNFLALEILKNKNINKLINTIHETLKEFGHSLVYETFTPHVSLLWSNNNFNDFINEDLLNELVLKQSPNEKGYLKILSFEDVYITIGSKTEKIKLIY